MTPMVNFPFYCVKHGKVQAFLLVMQQYFFTFPFGFHMTMAFLLISSTHIHYHLINLNLWLIAAAKRKQIVHKNALQFVIQNGIEFWIHFLTLTCSLVEFDTIYIELVLLRST